MMSVKIKKYRRDVDGLRAIAVLLVIFYHLGLSFAQAGFIGVDVFFVISGFLITQHIFCEFQAKKFKFKTFYLRRMRRILPALLLLLVVTTVASFFIFLPVALLRYAQSMLATILSVSNFYFYKTIVLGYFSTDAKVFPLLHTWTLAVEEQFYIFWPLVFLSMLKKFSLRSVFLFTLILSVFSFSLYYTWHSEHKSLVYFFPVTRGFELLMGALLGMSYQKLPAHFSKGISNCLAILGLSLIFYAGCYLDSHDYPSVYILFPCIGALLLLFTGKYSTIVAKILSVTPLVFVGLISYALYLWHWPILAYLHYLDIQINAFVIVLVLLSTFLISVLSWIFVEQVFRYHTIFTFGKTFYYFILLPLLLCLCLIGLLIFYPNSGFNTVSKKAYQVVNTYYASPASVICMHVKGRVLPPEENCMIGSLQQKSASVLVVGDSHAHAASGMLSVLLEAKKMKGYVVSLPSTPFILGHIHNWLAADYLGRTNLIKQLIKKNKYRYVVMGGYWDQYSDYSIEKNKSEKYIRRYKILSSGLKKAVKFVIDHGATPVILLDVPPLLNVSKYCGFTRLSKYNQCYNSKDKIDIIQKKTREIIIAIQRDYPKTILIDPDRLICAGQRCYAALNGMPLYYTGGHNSHLNYAGSVLLGKFYLQHKENPFLR